MICAKATDASFDQTSSKKTLMYETCFCLNRFWLVTWHPSLKKSESYTNCRKWDVVSRFLGRKGPRYLLTCHNRSTFDDVASRTEKEVTGCSRQQRHHSVTFDFDSAVTPTKAKKISTDGATPNFNLLNLTWKDMLCGLNQCKGQLKM